MRLHQRIHALESKVVARCARRRHGGAPALVRVTPVNPGAGQPKAIGARVVVKQALRGVQDVLLVQAEVFFQAAQHVFEIARIGLVGTDVLRAVDRVELHMQAQVAGAK